MAKTIENVIILLTSANSEFDEDRMKVDYDVVFDDGVDTYPRHKDWVISGIDLPTNFWNNTISGIEDLESIE